MRHVLMVLLLLSIPADGRDLRITRGVKDDQVLQRTAEDRAHVSMSGVASGVNGQSIEARVTRENMVVEGLDWFSIAKVESGEWTGEVQGIPTGGPYRIEVRIAGSSHSFIVNNVLVGDLWVLGGQSNMQGCGNLVAVEQPHPLVHSFDLKDCWLLAADPLHRFVDAVDRAHWDGVEGRAERKDGVKRWRGAGLGLPFAVEMVRRTGVPIGLIPCAHGGSSMEQWDPGLKDQGGDSLYGAMLRRVHAAGGKVTGILWYQGESDTKPHLAPLFQERFQHFILSIRRDLNQPRLFFYFVQLARFVTTNERQDDDAWNLVQESQRKVATSLPDTGMVAAIDVELDDIIHVGTQGLKRLGARLANLACRELFSDLESCRELKQGPRPLSVALENDVHAKGTNNLLIRVSFAEVNGGLQSSGRVAGFSIHSPTGEMMPIIFKAEIDPKNRTEVLLHIHPSYSLGTTKLPDGATLHYGYGKDPYCNLRDKADLAVPVFGPMPIQ